jgi:hypothetical protein
MTMNIKLTVLASLLGATLSGAAHAGAVEFFDFDADSEVFLRNVAAPGNVRDWVINIDYDPSLWSSVTTASLWLKLSDDGDSQPEAAVLPTFSPDWVISPLRAGTTPSWYLAGDVTAQIADSGLDSFLTVLAPSPGKDFFYNNAKLVVSFVPVPEAAEALLMGVGLLAVVGLTRKRRAVANWA